MRPPRRSRQAQARPRFRVRGAESAGRAARVRMASGLVRRPPASHTGGLTNAGVRGFRGGEGRGRRGDRRERLDPRLAGADRPLRGGDRRPPVDPRLARRELPYRTTIAHGLLTLSLLPAFFPSVLRIEGLKNSLN